MIPFFNGYITGSQNLMGFNIAVYTLSVFLPAGHGKIGYHPVSQRFAVHIKFDPAVIVDLIISGTALVVNNSKVGFHIHGTGQRIQEMLEILQGGTNLQSPVHENSFPVHHL